MDILINCTPNLSIDGVVRITFTNSATQAEGYSKSFGSMAAATSVAALQASPSEAFAEATTSTLDGVVTSTVTAHEVLDASPVTRLPHVVFLDGGQPDLSGNGVHLDAGGEVSQQVITRRKPS
ncbi:hypothetical protein [Saccharothrix coeruleofusca]|uniref:Uncharacterized protein n=1 Tax=Saccharothrix coeruleofusca TaxID=33919 RepID=A0A918ALV3_9PSEU|nr:hypothetical protein [Saccharothrix coeruleofusca]GGP56469.1 hypothetical protein GCM10010185_30760 [Saccharothrix coeruleofusca]